MWKRMRNFFQTRDSSSQPSTIMIANQSGTPKPLPTEVLVGILRHLDSKQIHTSAALVNWSWHAAAAALTASLDIRIESDSSSSSISRWLHRNGTALSDLRIAGPKQATADTPAAFPLAHGQLHQQQATAGAPLAFSLACGQLPQLQHLKLSNLDLRQYSPDVVCNDTAASAAAAAVASAPAYDMGEASSAASNPTADAATDRATSERSSSIDHALTGLTSLTNLELQQVGMSSWPGGFNALSVLTQLQQLYLWPATSAGTISTTALGQLTQLTILHIHPGALDHAPGGLSGLQSLQKLEYIHQALADPRPLAGLPTTLTSLQFDWATPEKLNSPEGMSILTTKSAPALQRLSMLQHLHIRGLHTIVDGTMSARIVSNLTQLTHLTLRQGLHDKALPGLLSALEQLQQLRHLALACNEVISFCPDRQRLSALTTSSHLTYLNLQLCEFPRFPGAAEYIFPKGGAWPDLQTLLLGAMSKHDHGESTAVFGKAALQRLVSDFPRMKRLCLVGSLGWDADETTLLQLTGLTSLGITARRFTDDTMTDLLPKLATIQDLSLWATGLTDFGVAQLTALTSLTQLVLSGSKISHWMMKYPNPWRELMTPYLLLSSDPGKSATTGESKDPPLPVWRQLQELCKKNPYLPTGTW